MGTREDHGPAGLVTGRGSAPEFPLHVLSEYALLADGERGVMVGPRGDFVWMCVPCWHSDAVFSALIGGGGGGPPAPAPPTLLLGGGPSAGTPVLPRPPVTPPQGH